MPVIVDIFRELFAFAVAIVVTISGFFADSPVEISISPQSEPLEIILVSPEAPQETGIEENEAKIDDEPLEIADSETEEETVTPEAEVDVPPPPEEPAITTPPPSPPTFPTQEVFADINTETRAALVNILCEMRRERVTQTVTGSGVIIDPRGIILTNAHLAQFFLLSDYPREGATVCTVRTGNPARDAYRAELLYIPLTWVREHADEISIESPSGTGEGDYALVRISESTTQDEELPDEFPHLPPNTDEEVVAGDESVLVASYPALVSNPRSIRTELFLTSTLTRVGTLFTFGDNLLDLFALSENIVAQRGSSGGAVVNSEGELVGLIVTSTDEALILNRQLRALTPAYINRNLLQENGTSLEQVLFSDPVLRAKAFNLTTAPLLTDLLEAELDR